MKLRTIEMPKVDLNKPLEEKIMEMNGKRL